MKRTFFLLSLTIVTTVYAAGLKVDLSRYSNYTYFNGKELKLVLHESLSKEKAILQKSLKAWRDTFSRIEKICPDTTASFKKNKYKLYLYRLPSSRGGMEFIRDGQSRWDKRINFRVNKGIIIPRAYTYTMPNHREEGFVYLLHEMAHYRHVVMMGEGGTRDAEIRKAYLNSLRNPRYAGTYARKNYFEYFAEISIAYLLKKHNISVFPSGSKELYTGDRVGYDLCKRIWGSSLSAFKPSNASNPTRLASALPFEIDWGIPNLPEPEITPFKDAYDAPITYPNKGLFQDRLRAHATSVFKRPSEKEILVSKQFLEIRNMMDKAEAKEAAGDYAISNWLHSTSLSMLIEFKGDNPHWNASVIDRIIKRIDSKIN